MSLRSIAESQGNASQAPFRMPPGGLSLPFSSREPAVRQEIAFWVCSVLHERRETMLEWRSMALAVVLCGGCRVTPDGDHLDRSGHYHEEVVDEGSYAVYQHQGASWEKVGFVWVGPDAEHSVWVLRRPGVGGYPY